MKIKAQSVRKQPATEKDIDQALERGWERRALEKPDQKILRTVYVSMETEMLLRAMAKKRKVTVSSIIEGYLTEFALEEIERANAVRLKGLKERSQKSKKKAVRRAPRKE